MSRKPIFLQFPMSQTPSHHVKNYGKDAFCGCICFHQNKQNVQREAGQRQTLSLQVSLPRKLWAQVHQFIPSSCGACLCCNMQVHACTTTGRCAQQTMVMKRMGKKNQLLKLIFSLLAKLLLSSVRNQGSV